jgi:hypothetical protein
MLHKLKFFGVYLSSERVIVVLFSSLLGVSVLNSGKLGHYIFVSKTKYQNLGLCQKCTK